MRDFRDAKAMAQTLREAMASRGVTLTHSETLEIVSAMLGLADWNTLSAAISADRAEPGLTAAPAGPPATLPVLPIKDFVPFPVMQAPLWIKRPKTVEALTQAFSNRRELVVVAQKDPGVEDPGPGDVYDIGVRARVLDVGPPSAEALLRSPMLEGSTQVLLQTEGRVRLRNFAGAAGGYEAQVELIDEGAITASPDMVETAAARFDAYAAAHDIPVPKMWPALGQLHDPGRVADIIAQRMPLSMADRQAVLATLDPLARLQLVISQMGG